jgi:CheY-like chemotaxis protein
MITKNEAFEEWWAQWMSRLPGNQADPGHVPNLQKENWDTIAPPQLHIQKVPKKPVLPGRAAASKVPHRVLVVDDEPSIREITGLMLQSEGYEVLTATDGLDGLHALNKFRPEVIISDLNMPRMSGFEFLSIVRKRFPQIATIAMSGDYIPSEIQVLFWPTLSSRKENLPSRSLLEKLRSSWPVLLSDRKVYQVVSLSARDMRTL